MSDAMLVSRVEVFALIQAIQINKELGAVAP